VPRALKVKQNKKEKQQQIISEKKKIFSSFLKKQKIEIIF